MIKSAIYASLNGGGTESLDGGNIADEITRVCRGNWTKYDLHYADDTGIALTTLYFRKACLQKMLCILPNGLSI